MQKSPVARGKKHILQSFLQMGKVFTSCSYIFILTNAYKSSMIQSEDVILILKVKILWLRETKCLT